MVNTLIAWVLVGVFGWVWWFAGTNIAFIADGTGEPTDAYWWFTILGAALLARGK